MGMFGDNVGAEEFALFGGHAGGAAGGGRGARYARGGGAAGCWGERACSGFDRGVAGAGGGFGGRGFGEDEFFAGVVDGPVEFDSVDAAWGARGVEDAGDVGAVDFFDFGFEVGEGVEAVGAGVGFGEGGEGGELVDGGDFHFAQAGGVGDLAGAEEGLGPEADGLAFFAAADEIDEVSFEEEHGGVLPAQEGRAKKFRGGRRDSAGERRGFFREGAREEEAPDGEGEHEGGGEEVGVAREGGDVCQDRGAPGGKDAEDGQHVAAVEGRPCEDDEEPCGEGEGGKDAEGQRVDGEADAPQEDEPEEHHDGEHHVLKADEGGIKEGRDGAGRGDESPGAADHGEVVNCEFGSVYPDRREECDAECAGGDGRAAECVDDEEGPGDHHGVAAEVEGDGKSGRPWHSQESPQQQHEICEEREAEEHEAGGSDGGVAQQWGGGRLVGDYGGFGRGGKGYVGHGGFR